MARIACASLGIFIFIVFFLSSGCATSANTVKIDDATAAKLRTEVTVYDSKKITGLEYKTVRQISATTCGSRENAIDRLRYVAHSAGADGIMKVSCSTLLGPTMVQNCLTTVMCEAVAISVGANKVKAEKVEPEKIAAENVVTERVKGERIERQGEKQVLSEGAGFTLGKLPIVVTSCDAVGKANDVEIIFSGNYVAKGKILKRDEENNLAIISFQEFRRTPHGFLIFPSYKVKTGQNIYVLGSSPKTQSKQNTIITEGVIAEADSPGGDSRYFRMTAKGGLPSGGSPLLDAQGRVIGIVLPVISKAPVREPLPEGTYFALKSTVLLNLYPEIEGLVTSENEPPISAQAISDAYGNSVVTVIAK